LALFAGTAEKIAQDIVSMQRTEIGEIEEAFHMGKVGSSTMAQKRNPSTALMLISLCRMMSARLPLVVGSMVRMDEGDSSASNVSDVAIPEVGILSASIAATLDKLIGGLDVHVEAMSKNAGITNGQSLRTKRGPPKRASVLGTGSMMNSEVFGGEASGEKHLRVRVSNRVATH
jgi:adenylosuccinate lyase/3-carboxy-cis,cis-muconate cycloisomerase